MATDESYFAVQLARLEYKVEVDHLMDDLGPFVASVRQLCDRYAAIKALRAEKGKQMSKVNQQLARQLADQLERLHNTLEKLT